MSAPTLSYWHTFRGISFNSDFYSTAPERKTPFSLEFSDFSHLSIRVERHITVTFHHTDKN